MEITEWKMNGWNKKGLCCSSDDFDHSPKIQHQIPQSVFDFLYPTDEVANHFQLCPACFHRSLCHIHRSEILTKTPNHSTFNQTRKTTTKSNKISVFIFSRIFLDEHSWCLKLVGWFDHHPLPPDMITTQSTHDSIISTTPTNHKQTKEKEKEKEKGFCCLFFFFVHFFSTPSLPWLLPRLRWLIRILLKLIPDRCCCWWFDWDQCFCKTKQNKTKQNKKSDVTGQFHEIISIP